MDQDSANNTVQDQEDSWTELWTSVLGYKQPTVTLLEYYSVTSKTTGMKLRLKESELWYLQNKRAQRYLFWTTKKNLQMKELDINSNMTFKVTE